MLQSKKFLKDLNNINQKLIKNNFQKLSNFRFMERKKGFEYFTHFEFVIVDKKFRKKSIETLLDN